MPGYTKGGASPAVIIIASFLLVLVILLFGNNIVLAILIYTSDYYGVSDRVHGGTIKANMARIQLGLEEYAEDHQGNFPECITSSQFDWSKYVDGSPLDNPFSRDYKGTPILGKKISGRQIVEKCLLTDSLPAYTIAQSDTMPFSEPGMIRYYVDRKTKRTYALIASDIDRDSPFWKLYQHGHDERAKQFEKKVITIKEKENPHLNFTLHN